MAKKIKTEEPEVDPKAELSYAGNQLARFKKRRSEAKTPEELVEMTLWVEHWTKIVEGLKNK